MFLVCDVRVLSPVLTHPFTIFEEKKKKRDEIFVICFQLIKCDEKEKDVFF